MTLTGCGSRIMSQMPCHCVQSLRFGASAPCPVNGSVPLRFCVTNESTAVPSTSVGCKSVRENSIRASAPTVDTGSKRAALAWKSSSFQPLAISQRLTRHFPDVQAVGYLSTSSVRSRATVSNSSARGRSVGLFRVEYAWDAEDPRPGYRRLLPLLQPTQGEGRIGGRMRSDRRTVSREGLTSGRLWKV